jgi:hypothetical protein
MRVLALALVLCACKGAESPNVPPGTAGEQCAIGNRVVRTCAAPLRCETEPFGLPPEMHVGETMRTPDLPNGEGGTCGGIAGFHCVEGLVCDVPENQRMAADAVGTCTRVSTCRR